MRWSIIRTIWLREMRDQLRDRRTLIMIVGLPLFLYPVLGLAVLQFAVGFAEQPSIIGIVTGANDQDNFPPRQPPEAGRSIVPAVIGSVAPASLKRLPFDYPCFVENHQFTVFDFVNPPPKARELAAHARLSIRLLERPDPDLLAQREVDVMLEVDPDFFRKLDEDRDPLSGQTIPLHIRRRDDDRGRLALRRLTPLLDSWKRDLRKVRLTRIGMSERFLDPIEIRQPDDAGAGSPARENVLDLMVKVFPVLLVMWCLAGALYPAVDLCAGEKERGTMETLLITPAGRAEIVLGKFLTIWIFSFGTAILNLLSMGITTALCFQAVPHAKISTAALLWCVVLSLPQSAFFSALGLAIGAYARSSKEGQYYLMPLFVVTMPLVFLTLAPGVELNPLYSLVPVTGVALLMQKLMASPHLGEIPWGYFVPVLFPIGVYSWLALRWAIEQFNREDVLFREAERLDIGLWLRRLFREKEPVPTTGQAFFALTILIALRWISLGLGGEGTPEATMAISELAFVAVPPLFMALILTTHPGDGLYLSWPKPRESGLAVLLALLMLPPMIALAQAVVWRYPQFLDGTHPLIAILRAIRDGHELEQTQIASFLLAFALVPALCEELAFRGFVLRGLHHGFRPRNAVLLSSFFFAVFHLNVFLFIPTFLLGVVAGLLTVRSKSLLPAILFHFLYNAVLVALIPLGRYSQYMPTWLNDAWGALIGLCAVLAIALMWRLYRRPYVELEQRSKAAGTLPERDQSPKVHDPC